MSVANVVRSCLAARSATFIPGVSCDIDSLINFRGDHDGIHRACAITVEVPVVFVRRQVVVEHEEVVMRHLFDVVVDKGCKCRRAVVL